MERESFEDEAIARQLADGFVAIKVDREELPDVDHVYMTALQALTRHGGWPMNMFLTPQLAPFYGGTYFPPQPSHGLPSFADLLRAVREAWTTRRAEIETQAQSLLDHLRQGTALPRRPAANGQHTRAVEQLARQFDAVHGGFGSAPKFPQSPLLHYLLALAALGNSDARTMLEKTLLGMAAGGMYDHVGGGFARYSTDERWHVPHFEKMLYDNAQLARVYAGAYKLGGDERFRLVAEDTLAYMQREMHPAAAMAAFSSAQDADAEGVEGRFHVWTVQQLREVLGGDADAAMRLYGVTEDGNWEHGTNVLERRDPRSVQTALGLSPRAWRQWEASVRERLYAARSRRVWPLTDDKVLADWNGLALRAFAEVGRWLRRDDLVQSARNLATFLLQTMIEDGKLRHAWRNGALRRESYLADHAQVGLGLLELHAASGEFKWLDAAHRLGQQIVEKFHVAGDGFYDGEQGALPLRARDAFDGAAPSGTAAACELLLRLAAVYDRRDWVDIVQQTLDRHAAVLEQAPSALPGLALAQLLGEQGAELALPTPPAAEDVFAPSRAEFAPLLTIVSAPPDSVPLLAARPHGHAYLCRQGSCQLPARSLDELQAQIAALWA
jgi:uncharacterized protein YyaL (SSP411 family)